MAAKSISKANPLSSNSFNVTPVQSKKRSHDGALLAERAPFDNRSREIEEAKSQVQPVKDLDSSEVYGALLNVLDGIDDSADATFATNGILPNAANPGLVVADLGGIGLPLSDHDAHRLAGICHQAPFGKGSETVVDTKIRKTLELNPSQFELQNPAWQQTLNDVVAQVANGLGIAVGAASVRAELYKLLLYEEGAFFDRHRDSEKAPGMLGTLVISLPSFHTGGIVEASFGKETRVLATAPNSRFGFSYLAWYADVEHAVQKITLGYRLVLTYNLIYNKQGTPPRAETHTKPELEILKLLQLQDQEGNEYFSWPLAYMLEHKYTEANLKMDNLKGKDRARAFYVQQACQRHGLSLFLANMVHEVSGGCDESNGYGSKEFHAIDEEYDRSLSLKIMVHPNGSVRARDLPFEEEYILQDEPFDRDPDDEDYSGWTGNEGVSATHWYRDSCIVIMPDDEDALDDLNFESALSSILKAKNLLGSLLDNLREAERTKTLGASNPDLERCKKRVSKFCTLFVSTKHSSHYDTIVLGDFVSATVLLDRVDLFQLATSMGRPNCFPSTYRNIGSALTFQLSEPAKWQQGIAQVLRRSETNLQGTWARLCAVREGFENSLREGPASSQAKISLDSLNDWIYTTLTGSLTILNSPGPTDGDTLIKIAQEAQDCERFLFRTMLPYVKRHTKKRDFVLATLRALYKLNQAGRISKAVTVNLYRDILSDFGLDLLKFQEADNVTSLYGSYNVYTDRHGLQVPKGPRINVDPNNLATLCGQSLSLGLNDEVQKILQDIVSKSEQYDIRVFESTWVSVLRNFLPYLKALPDHMSKQYRAMFQGILDTYIRRFLIKRPPQPTENSPKQLGCRACEACRELDKFLADPKQEVGIFARTAPIRKHLEMRINGYYETSVEKVGSPHKLLVHKEPGEFRALRAMADFNERREQVAKDITSIGIPALNRLLGTKGNELIDFDSLRNRGLVDGSVTRAPLTGISGDGNANRTNLPPVDIIDLTK